jgi:hypothetical protein
MQDYELHIAAQMLREHFGDDALAIAQEKAAGAEAPDASASARAWAKVIPLLMDLRVTANVVPFNGASH